MTGPDLPTPDPAACSNCRHCATCARNRSERAAAAAEAALAEPSGPVPLDTVLADALRDRIAGALTDWTWAAAGGASHMPKPDAVESNSLARAGAVMAVVGPELAARDAEIERLRVQVAEYENTLTWETTCSNCARLLDSGYAETVRAETAEAAVARHEAEVERLNTSVLAAYRSLRHREAERDEIRTALTEARKIGSAALEAWTPEYEYAADRAARKGYGHDETAAQVYGAAIEAVTALLAALDRGGKPGPTQDGDG